MIDASNCKPVANPQREAQQITIETFQHPWRNITRFVEPETIFVMVYRNYKIDAYFGPIV